MSEVSCANQESTSTPPPTDRLSSGSIAGWRKAALERPGRGRPLDRAPVGGAEAAVGRSTISSGCRPVRQRLLGDELRRQT